jgi:hypothetical protein
LGVDVLALASGKLKRVLPLPTATVWSPDGQRIAFVGPCTPPSTALCTARPDGTDVRAFAPLPSGGEMFDLTWLDDAR